MIVSRKITLTLDARLSCDLFTQELKIQDPKGIERKPTNAELAKILNGYRLYPLELV